MRKQVSNFATDASSDAEFGFIHAPNSLPHHVIIPRHVPSSTNLATRGSQRPTPQHRRDGKPFSAIWLGGEGRAEEQAWVVA